MDPSALIFVALAVAWAVYLIPKALEHHEESARTRTVERFSKTMRVLARREPVNRRTARLVPAGAPSSDPVRSSEARLSSHGGSLDDKQRLHAHRLAAARAAKRRLRVVTLILVANVGVAVAAYLTVFDWVWCAVPVGVLAVWLVACRVMVKRERAVRPRGRIPAEIPGDRPADPRASTGEIARVDAPVAEQERDPDSWDPVSVPLPTYVSKPVAARSVTTIDLDSTGVWSSGHNAADSRLAREAEAVDRSGSESAATDRRASGA
ncbi:hypothetical protein [Nocardioides halotolerans]|uniref:divisome protein SepX/GlpR n=1 Tax=Nocardioides halotolerans TaxID=433660 RepID=UPI00040B4A09|nr:hypothetical protein [Nocardioides halotolerans]